MADTPLSEQKQLTWQEKLDQGIPLNALEETKADADFNFKRRQREEEERKAFEKLKSAGRTESTDFSADDGSNDGKKGK